MRQGRRQGSNTETCHSQSCFRPSAVFEALSIQPPVTSRFSRSCASLCQRDQRQALIFLGRQTFFAHPTGSTWLQFLYILQPTPPFSLQPSLSTQTHLFPHYS